jgi:hypothetical protein
LRSSDILEKPRERDNYGKCTVPVNSCILHSLWLILTSKN